MRGIKGYRWSRCNVARGNVSCIVALQCLLADGFNLKIPRLYFHIVTEYIEANVTHITLKPVTCFLQIRISQELHYFASGKVCLREEVKDLSINYTQLTLKVKFFFKKGWLFQKIVVYNTDFQVHTIKISVESAAFSRTLLTYSSVFSGSPFNSLRLRVTF